jgi:ABC-2 type transport system permease protein
VRPGVGIAYVWELRKLIAQKRTYIGVGSAALLPIVFVTVMGIQSGGPYDAPLGHNLRKTGLALGLVVLTFASRFGAQLVTALVAGDIVSSEHANGTLKMIFTRSLRRSTILTGKTLAAFTYVLVLLLALCIAGWIGGGIAWGFHPLTNLSAHRVSVGGGLALTIAALAIFAVPLVSIACFGIFLSVVTRNSSAAIVGTLVYELAQEAVGGLVHASWAKHYLLSDQFDAWQAVFQSPTYWTAIVRAIWVSAAWGAIPLALAYARFGREDVAGG